MIRRETASPSPVPGMPAAGAPPRKKGSKIWARCSGSIPVPSSSTQTRAEPFDCVAPTVIVPPAGENLTAFESTFPTTCASRERSASTSNGVSRISSASRWSSSCASVSSACSSTQRADVEQLAAKRELPLFDQARVEEVADEARQPGRLRVDDLQVAHPVGLGDVPFEQQPGEAEDARERRPDLVRDHADQLGLVPLGLLEALGARDELVAARSQRVGHRVEGAAELAELVAPLLVEPDVEVAGRDRGRCVDRAAKRSGDGAREPDAERDQQDRRDQQRDEPGDGRAVREAVRVGAAIGRVCGREPGERRRCS